MESGRRRRRGWGWGGGGGTGGDGSRRAAVTVALLSAGAENFASIVAAREGRRESTVTMETSISLTHTTNPLRTHSGLKITRQTAGRLTDTFAG